MNTKKTEGIGSAIAEKIQERKNKSKEKDKVRQLADYFSDDTTFCGKDDCKDIECFRNNKNIRIKEIPHSFSMFEGTQYCPSYYKDLV